MTEGSILEWTAEPFLSTAELRFTPSTPADNRVVDCDDFVNIQCTVLDFQATVSIANAGMSLADLTSTFRFTARAELNGTVVRCRVADVNGVAAQNETLKAAGM